MIKITFPVNYSVYIPLLRGVLFLVKSGVLPLAQLGPYVCFVMQADFDMRHPNYGVILRDDKQLSDDFGVSQTTIYRARKALIRAGLLIEKDGKTKIPNYYMFELEKVKKLTKAPHATLQKLFTTPQENISDIEEFIANMKDHQPEKPVQSSNVSSKGRSLSEEDVDWINKNVKEYE